jgi:hypothetical protein
VQFLTNVSVVVGFRSSAQVMVASHLPLSLQILTIVNLRQRPRRPRRALQPRSARVGVRKTQLNGLPNALGRVAIDVLNAQTFKNPRNVRIGALETATLGLLNVLGKAAKSVLHAMPIKSQQPQQQQQHKQPTNTARTGVKTTTLIGIRNVHGKAAGSAAHVQKIAGSR